MTVRPYQPDDLEDTVQLWYQTWHQTFPRDRFCNKVDSPYLNSLLSARDVGVVEGCPLYYEKLLPHIQHPQPYSEWKTRFRNDLTVRGSVWIAELENRLVGFVVVIKEEQSLDQIFVDPTYQNRGIGVATCNHKCLNLQSR